MGHRGPIRYKAKVLVTRPHFFFFFFLNRVSTFTFQKPYWPFLLPVAASLSTTLIFIFLFFSLFQRRRRRGNRGGGDKEELLVARELVSSKRELHLLLGHLLDDVVEEGGLRTWNVETTILGGQQRCLVFAANLQVAKWLDQCNPTCPNSGFDSYVF